MHAVQLIFDPPPADRYFAPAPARMLTYILDGCLWMVSNAASQLVASVWVLQRTTIASVASGRLCAPGCYLPQVWRAAEAIAVCKPSGFLRAQVHGNGPVLDDEILADPEVQAAIREEGSVQRAYDITNVDRAAFGRVGGAVARLHGDSGFAGTLSFELQVRAHACLWFSWRGVALDGAAAICLVCIGYCP